MAIVALRRTCGAAVEFSTTNVGPAIVSPLTRLCASPEGDLTGDNGRQLI